MITNKQLKNLEEIFDKNRKIDTDDDLLELAALTEDESNEEDLATHTVNPDI